MIFSSLCNRFDAANLRLRMISSLIMVPGALLAVYLGGVAYQTAVTIAMILGLYEWLRLVAPGMPGRTVGISCVMLIVVLSAGSVFSPFIGGTIGLVLTGVLFVLARRDHDDRALWIALGMPYMGGSGLALLSLRATPGCGAAMVFFLLATVWGTDVGAYVAGRLIGGPKLAPRLSPSKTWAGLFGGVALAVILGYFAADALGAMHPEIALIVSPILAVVAQAGDLFESYFKRRSGVKESGDLIPGHGGVLDRIDGLVFAAIFMALFQLAIGEQINWW